MTDLLEADHYSKIKPSDWPWKSFSPAEIACRGTGKIKISRSAMTKLQALRNGLGAPMIINSAYRSPEHNRAVGGAKNSNHMHGVAFDVSMSNHNPAEFEAAARAAGFTGFGFYPPKKGNFIHIDTGAARVWGTRWTAAKFQPEPKAPTATAKQVATAAAPVGIAGVVELTKLVDTDSLKTVQETVQPMIPYSSIFQTIFVVCGVGIALWVLWNRYNKKTK